MRLTCLLFFLAAVPLSAAELAPADTRACPRTADWAGPLVETAFENTYRVSVDLFRCKQPGTGDFADLRALSVCRLLELREYHTSSSAFTKGGRTLIAEPMNAGEVSVDQLIATVGHELRAAFPRSAPSA